MLTHGQEDELQPTLKRYADGDAHRNQPNQSLRKYLKPFT